MEIISLPAPLGSVFGPLCIELANVAAPDGLDIEIRDLDTDELIGVKRIYTTGQASVNVAPYLRGRLTVNPFAGKPAGTFETPKRTAGCYVVMNGVRTELGRFTGGAIAARMGEVLSTAPITRKIATGERDEIPYAGSDGKMYTRVVIAGEEDFEVEIPGIGTIDYVVDKTGGGMRLAWVNCYGAVDYYTFPRLDKSRFEGNEKMLTLVSEPMGEAGAEWLAELFSSPAVWRVGGDNTEPVKVENGTIETSPERPTRVKATIVPSKKQISRRV